MNNEQRQPYIVFLHINRKCRVRKTKLAVIALKISPLNDFKQFNNSYYKKTSNVSSVFTYQVI